MFHAYTLTAITDCDTSLPQGMSFVACSYTAMNELLFTAGITSGTVTGRLPNTDKMLGPLRANRAFSDLLTP